MEAKKGFKRGSKSRTNSTKDAVSQGKRENEVLRGQFKRLKFPCGGEMSGIIKLELLM